MFDIVEKYWPMSVGDGKATRKKRPRILAITTDCCTGCAGSPACIEYCPIEACMFWVPDEDHPPFGRIEFLCQIFRPSRQLRHLSQLKQQRGSSPTVRKGLALCSSLQELLNPQFEIRNSYSCPIRNPRFVVGRLLPSASCRLPSAFCP